MTDITKSNVLLGALIGDAIGARLEFQKHITCYDIDEAFKMPGGGILNIGPGQYTDDGELPLSLASSILNMKYYDINKVAGICQILLIAGGHVQGHFILHSNKIQQNTAYHQSC